MGPVLVMSPGDSAVAARVGVAGGVAGEKSVAKRSMSASLNVVDDGCSESRASGCWDGVCGWRGFGTRTG